MMSPPHAFCAWWFPAVAERACSLDASKIDAQREISSFYNELLSSRSGPARGFGLSSSCARRENLKF
eukprot:scaffold139373_cov28-Tisochrysis_lutea.AAC.1